MRLKTGYKIRNVAGENVIVRIGEAGVKLTQIISLNDTSTWLWEHLQGIEFDAAKVADLLCGEYEVERATAETDAARWLVQLSEAKLVEE
ncbi:MAG: PqqD family protein [Tidjanibacter sp.]|nr:PqqD family protein [Tidjanibacter sp.]